jgi:hypothetical protein
VFVLEALEVTLDVGGEEGIARLPTVAAGVFPSLDAKPVLTALSLLDVNRSDLWNLKGTQANERTELNDEIVALTVGGPPEVLDLRVCKPDLVLVPVGRFNAHYDYFSFRH